MLTFLKLLAIGVVVPALGMSLLASNAMAANKCMVNGTVTYQQSPCASEQVRKLPTLQELNAEEAKRRASAVPKASDKSASPAASLGNSLRCDGRKYCSQMSSCAEAKYFLASCPGVKMDGDNDGIPCEEQWCTAPMSR